MVTGLKIRLQDELIARGLTANGGFHPETGGTILLLSPGPAFWEIFTSSPEYADSAPDPMDRWSARVITGLAREAGAQAHFPFGPDAAPFFQWAQASGTAWPSPVMLLVGAEMGLNLSYRGALAFDAELPLMTAERPCENCAQPCLSACPVAALTGEGYDVPACKAYLEATPDAPCRTHGCLVRRACPASTPQAPAHAQFHMEAFLR